MRNQDKERGRGTREKRELTHTKMVANQNPWHKFVAIANKDFLWKVCCDIGHRKNSSLLLQQFCRMAILHFGHHRSMRSSYGKLMRGPAREAGPGKDN